MAVIAALALTVAPANANTASPVLEFVVPENDFPVDFEAEGGAVTAELTNFDSELQCTGSEGEGEITGPRSTASSYVFTGCKAEGGDEDGVECKSAGAGAEEIRSETIEADLVYIDQAKQEVGMLLNPQNGIYISFECGGDSVEARGPFLSPVGQINQVATSFTATLTRSGATQTPDEYENAYGEKRPAIPQGKRDNHPWVSTGVELGFTIHPSVALEIKAITAAEVEAKQQAEEAAAAEKKRQEEEAAKAAAEKKRQEDEAAKAAAEKKRQEDAAAAAAIRKLLDEQQAISERLSRQLALSKGLNQCRKSKSKKKRTRCEKRVKNQFGSQKAGKK